MITTEEIKHLADLARIEITDAEAEKMTKELDSILEYAGQIKEVSGDIEREVPEMRNVMRDDEPTNKAGEYTEALLNNAPASEGNYLKVKKIL
jgi:aspartyl-tRNA(Asn)/glutamyl-tRNA(Gln) amidotransferase subunit C